MTRIFTTTSFFPPRVILPRVSWFVTAILLASQVLTSCKEDANVGEIIPPVVEVVDTDTTALAKKLMKGTTIISKFKNDNFSQIAEGVTQTQIAFINKIKLPVKMFILEVDLKNPKLDVQALLPYNDYLNGLQTLSEMCKDNQKTGSKIVAAVSGDFFNSTGQPDGYFYIDGFGLRTARTAASRCYFATMKGSNTPFIGGIDPFTAKEVTVTLTNIQQAVSGRQWLVHNSTLVPVTDFSVTAKSAIGYTSANVVYAIVVDGGQDLYSTGLNMDEVAKIMLALGTTRAINLVGGFSTTVGTTTTITPGTMSTLVVKSPTANSWTMQNYPPKGNEGLVANGIGFVLKD